MADYKLQLRTHAEIFATREEALEYINDNQGQVLLGEPTVFFYGETRKPNVILAIGNKENTGGNGKVSIIDVGSLDADEINGALDSLNLNLDNLINTCGLTIDERMQPGYQIVYGSDKDIIRNASTIAEAIDILADKVAEIQPISDEGYNDISNLDNNNIIGNWNGLYAAVNLEYNPSTKKLIFKTSGKDSNGVFKTDAKNKEIDLSGLTTAILESTNYDEATNKLVLNFSDGTAVEIDMSEIFTDALSDYETVANAEVEYDRLDNRIDSIEIVKDDNSDYQYKLMVDNQLRSTINIPQAIAGETVTAGNGLQKNDHELSIKIDTVNNEDEFLAVGPDGLKLTGVREIKDNLDQTYSSLQSFYSVATADDTVSNSMRGIAKSYADGAKDYAEQVSRLNPINTEDTGTGTTRFGLHFDINNNTPTNKTIQGFVNVRFPDAPELTYNPATNTLVYNGTTTIELDRGDTFINGGTYDEESKDIVLTYANPGDGDGELRIPLDDLVGDLVNKDEFDTAIDALNGQISEIEDDMISDITVAPSDNLSVSIVSGRTGKNAKITLNNNASKYACTLVVQGSTRTTNVQDALDYLNSEMLSMKSDIMDLGDRITNIETTIDSILGEQSQTITDLTNQLAALAARVTAIENSDDFNNDGVFDLHNMDDFTDDTTTL